MTHKQILGRLNQDLDDLEVRNPKAYRNIESRLRRLEAEANFDVAVSPIGVKSMERMRWSKWQEEL